MSNLSQFSIGGKPLRVVTYTTGSGTFTPLTAGNWCNVTVVGGGGGGGYGGNGLSVGTYGEPGTGGNPGAAYSVMYQVVTTAAYAVGAAGAGGISSTGTPAGNGAATTFGTLSAVGGQRGAAAFGAYRPDHLAGTPGASASYGSGGCGNNLLAGSAATGYGCGGGGGSSGLPTGGYNGGAGSGGLIIIEEFGT